MQTEKYRRNHFDVDAVRVTRQNMIEVAEWTNSLIEKDEQDRDYIHVAVKNPLNPKQERAYVGDWVLKSDTGFKVYTNSAFNNHFNKLEETAKETSNLFTRPQGVDQKILDNIREVSDWHHDPKPDVKAGNLARPFESRNQIG